MLSGSKDNLEEVLLTKLIEVYKKLNKGPKIFLELLEGDENSKVLQKYKEIYVLLLGLMDGVGPDNFNFIGQKSAELYVNLEKINEKNKVLATLLKEIE